MQNEKPIVALCFLTADNPHPLMANSFQLPFFKQYFRPVIHAKFRERVSHPIQQYLVPRDYQVHTSWGSISLVAATLQLLRYALQLEPPIDYVILLSETHMPIMPWERLWLKIKGEWEQGKGRMNYHMGSPYRWFQLRKPYFIPQGSFLKHSQWVSMTREMAEFYVSPQRNYLNQFSRMIAPDEHYFVCVLAREKIIPGKHFLHKQTCYVKFRPGNNHPFIFVSVSQHSIQALVSQDYWFLRKVVPTTQIPNDVIQSILYPREGIFRPLQLLQTDTIQEPAPHPEPEIVPAPPPEPEIASVPEPEPEILIQQETVVEENKERRVEEIVREEKIVSTKITTNKNEVSAPREEQPMKELIKSIEKPNVVVVEKKEPVQLREQITYQDIQIQNMKKMEKIREEQSMQKMSAKSKMINVENNRSHSGIQQNNRILPKTMIRNRYIPF